MAAFPAANGLTRLDVIFGTTIFLTLLTLEIIRDIMILPAHRYSISCLGGGKSGAVAAEWGCPC